MRVIMSCGGSGGHVYPAVSIAEGIEKRFPGSEILFIGTTGGMENRLVPASGFAIRGIDASGFDRHHLLRNVRTLQNVLRGTREAKEIIREFGPDIVFGTGGYVTGTVVRTAAVLGIPCYIQEQNAFPGVTNRLLEHYAKRVFLSFEASRKYFRHPEKAVLSGNPIRAEFLRENVGECRVRQGLSPDDFMILIFGGSLGAEILTREALKLIRRIAEQPSGRRTVVTLISGSRYYEQTKAELEALPCDTSFVRLIAYADNMPELMGACDLVIGRSGGSTFEMLAMHKPSILIPSPNVTANHQYHNAKAVSDAGAALLIEEKDILESGALLTDSALALASDAPRLEAMSRAAAGLAKTDAVDIILSNL